MHGICKIENHAWLIAVTTIWVEIFYVLTGPANCVAVITQYTIV